MPKPFAVTAHGLEGTDLALVPVLDLSQDRLDIRDDRALAQASIDNRNQVGRDLVGKISPSPRRFRQVSVESDFVLVHLIS